MSAMPLMISDELSWTFCCVCGVAIGMPASLVTARRDDRKEFYCPNGHGQFFIESTADRLQRQVTQLERERDIAKARADVAEAKAGRAERALKRAKRATGK